MPKPTAPHKSMPNLWPMGSLEDGRGPHLPDLESGMSTGTPWPIWAPIAYLSKQLDMVTKGWPPCIQAMAAIAALVPKANKLSRYAPLTVCSPHTFRDLLSHQAFLSLPPSRVQVLHAFLLDPRLSFSPCSPLNPTSLLPMSSTTDSLLHSCSLTPRSYPKPLPTCNRSAHPRPRHPTLVC